MGKLNESSMFPSFSIEFRDISGVSVRQIISLALHYVDGNYISVRIHCFYIIGVATEQLEELSGYSLHKHQIRERILTNDNTPLCQGVCLFLIDKYNVVDVATDVYMTYVKNNTFQ